MQTGQSGWLCGGWLARQPLAVVCSCSHACGYDRDRDYRAGTTTARHILKTASPQTTTAAVHAAAEQYTRWRPPRYQSLSRRICASNSILPNSSGSPDQIKPPVAVVQALERRQKREVRGSLDHICRGAAAPHSSREGGVPPESFSAPCPPLCRPGRSDSFPLPGPGPPLPLPTAPACGAECTRGEGWPDRCSGGPGRRRPPCRRRRRRFVAKVRCGGGSPLPTPPLPDCRWTATPRWDG